MNQERYRCCEHCLNHPHTGGSDNHRVPCAVMACGRIDSAQQRAAAIEGGVFE